MRVGIIGCGEISQIHIPIIRRIATVEIVGVCDADRGKARGIAQRFGIGYACQGVSELLRERSPDVVHVLTPPQTHKELSVQGMASGCHVLVEKPMCLNVTEADEMIAASRRHGVILGVCHNYLYDPVLLEAKELVVEGTIGRVVSAEVFWRIFGAGNHHRHQTAQWLHDLPGGIFQEVAAHPVYMLMDFLKTLRVVSAVSKKTASDLPFPSDELRVLFDGESGLGSFSASVCTSPHLMFLNVYGTEMTLHADLATGTLVKLRRSGGGTVARAMVNIDHGFQLLSRTLGSKVQALRGRRKMGHETLIEKFYACIAEGSDPPVTGGDGRAVVAALDQIWAKLGCISPAPNLIDAEHGPVHRAV